MVSETLVPSEQLGVPGTLAPARRGQSARHVFCGLLRPCPSCLWHRDALDAVLGASTSCLGARGWCSRAGCLCLRLPACWQFKSVGLCQRYTALGRWVPLTRHLCAAAWLGRLLPVCSRVLRGLWRSPSTRSRCRPASVERQQGARAVARGREACLSLGQTAGTSSLCSALVVEMV